MNQIRIINMGRVTLPVKIVAPEGRGTVQLQPRVSTYLPPGHDVDHNYAVSTPDLRVERPKPKTELVVSDSDNTASEE